ncbi:MAG: tRNA pseudouridine(38-40) synthase TruA [Candidatus Hodarchaeales archaeon]|jgi:tRNA pseudouridine38-40 synthase
MGLYVAVKVAYIASKLHGWQIQPDVPTIEGVIRQALVKSNLISKKSSHLLKYAGRTDKGVNAIGQIISFPLITYKTIPDKFLQRINAYLPKSIRCWAYTEVDSAFHPRFDAEERIYHYIWCEPGLSNYDWNAVEKSCQALAGLHDFKNFSKNDPTCSSETKRMISSIKIIPKENDSVLIEFRAPSFLWQQCRRIANHLLQLARKEIQQNITQELLNKTVISKPSPLPPQFLILIDIKYPNLKFICEKDTINKITHRLLFKTLEHKRMFDLYEYFIELLNQDQK